MTPTTETVVIFGPEKLVKRAVEALEASDDWYIRDAGNPRGIELAPILTPEEGEE